MTSFFPNKCAAFSNNFLSRQLLTLPNVTGRTLSAPGAIGSFLGPDSGPVVGGFAAQAKGWEWPFLGLLWINGITFLLLFCLLPETLGLTVLVCRAERLRKLTGNTEIKSQTELNKRAGSTFARVALAPTT